MGKNIVQTLIAENKRLYKQLEDKDKGVAEMRQLNDALVLALVRKLGTPATVNGQAANMVELEPLNPALNGQYELFSEVTEKDGKRIIKLFAAAVELPESENGD